MTRVAAIDCGTNSIRLLVADVPAEGAHTDLLRRMEVVRLGQGVDATGRLAPEAIERTRRVLVEYAAQARDLGATAVRMVATSATRDAANRADFEAMVLDVLGQRPDVVAGTEEAELSFIGATASLDAAATAHGAAPPRPPFLVVDIGGGSTEFVLGDSDGVRAARSVDIGCVRLTERHLHDDPPTVDQIRRAEDDIRAALAQVTADVPVADAASLVGVAGSVTTVAAIALGLPAYDADAIHGSRIAGGRRPGGHRRPARGHPGATRGDAGDAPRPGRRHRRRGTRAVRAHGRVRDGRGRRQRARHPRRHRAAARRAADARWLSTPAGSPSPARPARGRALRPQRPRPRHPRRPDLRLLRLPPPGGLAGGGRAGQARLLPGRGLLGPAGARARAGRRADRRRRAGARGARRQPDRPRLHRRPQR